MSMARNIVLVGFMGTGKSAVGRLLAERLGREFVDLDALIVARAGCTISRIFETEGEAGFRRRERQAVREVAARAGLVVSTGGGVVLDADNVRDFAASGDLVCLTATPETILARVGDDTARPLLRGGDPLGRIRELLAARTALYAQFAHQVATDGLAAAAVAERVLRLLALSREKEPDRT